MHASRIIPSTLSILALLSQFQLSIASPLEPEESLEEATLEKRCSNPCGYYSQLCCSSSETCSTNSDGEAECVASGSWEYYTTTYVVTETERATFTSTWSSYVSATTSTGSCNAEYGETVCGSDCCGPAYVCSDNQCVLGSTSIWATATATPPVRGTTLSTVTQTATTTEPFTAPVSTSGTPLVVKGSGGGLSGGAIAGIVIGTIAGVFLLLLLCACMCCRGALDSVLACLGLGGGRKRRETTYVEERRRHHHSSSGARPEQRTWFGSRPAPSTAGGGKKKESGMGALATIGIVLGAIALCLGLKRRRDHRDADEKTDYTYPSTYYSYYSSDYYTNDGSVVTDDRRTRDTRRTRRSRTRSRR
ncbi:hypothetical protein CBS115989_10267 [Aspergillus niger]|uniref:Mid2 domain-containing protein n=1 Tax=Aspergillus niger ATCC 13496 TaxID=1353008 RepID=A0A370BUE9_ASPNG|nr:hypothetical protein ANI_1_1042014 [Aspergillus niger CBS 513.88]KAI2812620.1 hypothetical protein CBS115989_10267 [Aspergillus niger]KAI2839551.1 hypothetical protein CBS11232_9332 [Aspergillus niger]KAI2879222.1 hypothetical protein CBS115988_2378 [Aspergillus niger]RDH17705.1 hypothetical protein M747DRAFT_307843 [Aspergillus niger ATCC 13496]|eukprot:XP_001389204.2 hypothetical protein ANI_1_1042014 [Aspergillus niger CBS 513.88]